MSTVADLPPNLVEKLEEMSAQLEALERELEDPAVAADHNRLRMLGQKQAALRRVVDPYNERRGLLAEIADLEASAADPELAELARSELAEAEQRVGELGELVKRRLVGSAEQSIGGLILEIRAGTGGDEAGLWARDLLDVYERYSVSRGWKFEGLSLTTDAGIGGVRAASVAVAGDGAFQELRFESGVHSVKRVPATETQGRIHTSTATVAVLPEPEDVEVSIDWGNDVEEHITTAQGPGGQNVNKVATAVHLRHVPTGVEVRMQETKSQSQNREKARRLLKARVYEIELAKAEAERSAERRSQIGAGGRSEKIRVYRYQDGIVADQRLTEKFTKSQVLDEADLGPMLAALIEQDTARRLAEL